MSNISSNALLSNLNEFRSSGRYSDLTLSCGSKEFRVHKMVLDASSPVFRKLLSGDFKEAKKNSSFIELPDDDPEALEALINFLYTSTYSDSHIDDNKVASSAVQVYAIADKYGVQKLQDSAAFDFKEMCTPGPHLELEVDLEDFITAVSLVDECTSVNDSTLRKIVVDTVKKNIRSLLQNDKAKALILSMPELNVELLSLLDQTSGRPPIEAFTHPSAAPPKDGKDDAKCGHDEADDWCNCGYCC